MRPRHAPFTFVSIFMLLTGMSADLFGATINVPSDDYPTIQVAIYLASEGDVINIASGTYTEAGIEVNKSVTIQGQGESATIVQAHADSGQATDLVFHITGTMVTIKNLAIQHGNAWDTKYYGGGISNDKGMLTLSHCTIRRNFGGVGGIFNGGGRLILTNCTVTNNFGETGGIVSKQGGATTLTHCTVSNNAGWIGGIFNWPDSATMMTLTHCTLSNNSYGIANGGILTLTNCTLNNQCAGIFNSEEGVSTLINCTVSNNQGEASDAGGIVNQDGAVHIKNTIIAGNTRYGKPLDVDGVVNSLDYNLIEDIGDATIEGITTHNIYGVDPMLLPLADNGGFTQTCALQEGSPAINAGTGEDAPATDQRGYARVSAPDIGAYEYEGTTSAGAATWGQIKAMFR